MQITPQQSAQKSGHNSGITQAVLEWHAQHGRRDLPWQNIRDIYRIWVSEIMLQQTQVTTVIPYYQRFLQRFPSVADLASAQLDEVLHLWTGLGYYARARNLHKTAQIVCRELDGRFPVEHALLVALPGIGKSTAGAMLAFAEHQAHAILDGNVKRVLARVYAVQGWYGKKAVEQQLWQLAEANTPRQDVHVYTQAIMDFGATLCTRSKPSCCQCPLQSQCQAYAQDRVQELPHGKPKTHKPTQQTFMLLVKNNAGEFLLEQNPPTGIWGGLWCPPRVTELAAQVAWGGLWLEPYEHLAMVKHTFSHFHLEITPVRARIKAQQDNIAENAQLWYNPNSRTALGLAAPIKKILNQY